jgi:hypothetical protein
MRKTMTMTSSRYNGTGNQGYLGGNSAEARAERSSVDFPRAYPKGPHPLNPNPPPPPFPEDGSPPYEVIRGKEKTPFYDIFKALLDLRRFPGKAVLSHRVDNKRLAFTAPFGTPWGEARQEVEKANQEKKEEE